MSILGTTEPPAAGVYAGMGAREYRSIAAVNASLLKECRRSLAHGRVMLTRASKLPTDAMRLGTALHCHLLDRDRFDESVRIVSSVSSRSNAGKAMMAELDAEGVTPIDDDEWADVQAMSRAISAHPRGRRYAASKGQTETVIVWKDEVTGLTCKAKADKFWLLPDQPQDQAIDLKTTADASSHKLAKTINDLGYHVQAAFYRRAIRSVTGRECLFRFLFVESSPPYGVRVVELGDATMREGDLIVDRLLKDIALAMQTDVWPGYPERTDVVDIPTYAFTKGDFSE